MNSLNSPDTNDWLSPPSGHCDICGRSPARPLMYRGVSGLVLIQRYWSYKAAVCLSCSRGLFRQFQVNLVHRGWWSLLGMLLTPLLLFTNAATWYLHQHELEAPYPPNPDTEDDLEGRPLYQRVGPTLVTMAFFFVVVTGVV